MRRNRHHQLIKLHKRKKKKRSEFFNATLVATEPVILVPQPGVAYSVHTTDETEAEKKLSWNKAIWQWLCMHWGGQS